MLGTPSVAEIACQHNDTQKNYTDKAKRKFLGPRGVERTVSPHRRSLSGVGKRVVIKSGRPLIRVSPAREESQNLTSRPRNRRVSQERPEVLAMPALVVRVMGDLQIRLRGTHLLEKTTEPISSCLLGRDASIQNNTSLTIDSAS